MSGKGSVIFEAKLNCSFLLRQKETIVRCFNDLCIFVVLITMSFLIDIHTHNHFFIQSDVVKLVSLMAGEKIPPDVKNCLFSYGIHPWQLETQDTKSLIEIFEHEMTSNSFVAIGEIGIDKTRKIPLNLQIEIFEYQLFIANKKQLPVILHVVKATNEIMQSVSKIKPTVPMILHAFNSSKEQVMHYSKKGFYFSVGNAIHTFDSKMATSLKTIPIERLFFETDVFQQDIVQIYRKASEILHLDVENLRQKIFENFERCFPLSKLHFKTNTFLR